MTLAAYDPDYIPTPAMWFVGASLLWLCSPALVLIGAMLAACLWVTHRG